MRGWAWLLRLLVVFTLIVLAYLGIVRIIRGDPEPPQYNLPATVTVDTHAAAAMATRFATSYLTWDQDAPEDHADAIARDWVDAGDGGWNKKGKQSADSASVLAVTPLDGNRVDVRVLVRVVPKALSEEDKPAPSYWMALKIPAWVDETRASVIDTPILIGVPAPVTPPAGGTPITDAALTENTRDMATNFFTTYATGDVSAVTAPGSTIVAPVTTADAEVTGWTVYTPEATPTPTATPTGTDVERQATAIVTWTSGEVVTTQTYQVTISLVSGQTDSRWQVSALN